MNDLKMNERNSYTLEGFKRGKGDREILTCRRVLNILVFLGFMVNYMLRVNLNLAIVDMVIKSDKTPVNETLEIRLNRTTRSINSFQDTKGFENLPSNRLKSDDKWKTSSWNGTNPNYDEYTDESVVVEGEEIPKYRRAPMLGDNLLADQLLFSNTSSELTNQTGSNITENNENKTQPITPVGDHIRRFEWNENQQEYLISCFFWGYICTEIPGGRLSELIGAKKVFGYATLGATVLTLLTPMFAKINYYLLLFCRILLGVCLGPTWPAILPLASKWIPPSERSKFLSNMMASTLGAGFTLPVCGFIIASLSWEYVFYITGILSFVWCIFWFLLVYDSPSTHPRISDEERYYIESQLGMYSISNVDQPGRTRLENQGNEEKQVTQGLLDDTVTEKCHQPESDSSDIEARVTKKRNSKSFNGRIKDEADLHALQPLNSPQSQDVNSDQHSKILNKTKPKAPWAKIVLSVPVWAFVLTHASSVFGYFTVTNQLPTYMKHILHYNIKENGILSSLPYIGKYISAVIGGSIADWLIRSNKMSRNTIRKSFTSFGIVIPGIMMIIEAFFGSDKVLSVIIFTIAMLANGLVTGGYLGNSLELAPNFSGTVFGLANMFSGICGSLSGIMVAFFTNGNQVYGQWQKVFAITAVFYFCGAILFLCCGSTDVQPWNSIEQSEKSKNRQVNGNNS